MAGQALKATIDRQNNYQQAGERYRAIAQWERDDLITNLVDNLRQCDKHIQERMVWAFCSVIRSMALAWPRGWESRSMRRCWWRLDADVTSRLCVRG